MKSIGNASIPIIPKIVESSDEVFRLLEDKGLLRRLLCYPICAELNDKPYRVDTLYNTNERFGGHKLIVVHYNMSEPMLGFHEDKEDFILINREPQEHKNLFLLTALMNINELSEKIAEKTVSSEDFLIVKLKFNDPYFSFFTMNEGTPHCELTEKQTNKRPPCFFVTEPTGLQNNIVGLGLYEIQFSNSEL